MRNRRLLSGITGLLLAAFLSLAFSAQAADPDFSVRILGSGGPGYNPQRAEPSVLLRLGDDRILVDMGNGTQAGLAVAGLRPNQLSALFVTHHHLDHEQEFIPILAGCLRGRRAPVVVGPGGIKSLADFTGRFYRSDIAYRRAAIGAVGEIPEPEVREVKGGEKFPLSGIVVKTAAVNHALETIAYRFERRGRSVVISGDLTYSEGLVRLARNADILILDGGAAASAAPTAGNGPPLRKPGPNQPQDRQRAHSSFAEIVSMVVATRAKTVVLTHLSDRPIDEETVRSAISGAGATGTVILARDGLEL
jgi:ribonuclease BN (tRNA processing enzyme)